VESATGVATSRGRGGARRASRAASHL